MFCVKCGHKLDDNAIFCSYCGTKVINDIPNEKDEASQHIQPATQAAYVEISTTYAWALATVPIAVSILMDALFGYSINLFIAMIITIALNSLFAALDVQEIKKTGNNPGNWIWMGIFLVPVYLFVRASKTDHNLAYGIVWCALFVVDIII